MTTTEILAERGSWASELARGAFRDALPGAFPSGLALLATGAFARGELFPFSSADVLLLVESETAADAGKDAISHFLRLLWDAGLRVSHSVHTPAECAALHPDSIELNIGLLDYKPLAGDEALAARLAELLPRFFHVHGRELSRRLARLARARHAKFHNSIYHLEPNIQETPGGLRDLDAIRSLEKLGVRRETELDPALAAARDFLFDLRLHLHRESGRDNNVLNFDAQETFSDRPPEMMRQYYRHARVVYRALAQLMEAVEARDNVMLAQSRDWRSRVSTTEFTVSRDRIYLRAPQGLQTDPLMLVRLFQFVGRHGLRLSLDAELRVSQFLASAPVFDLRWSHWRDMLDLPHTTTALRAMQETGALNAFLPEWRHIECLVVRDFYHRYTVDEHTLVAIQILDSLPDGRFGDLRAEARDSMPQLRFALLLHDIGKGTGREHVGESLRVAELAMARLKTPEEDRATVNFLIAHHLDLSSAMTGRDLDDQATILELAAAVGTLERLRLLTLLTYADISAVNPAAMNPWRTELLWRVYLSVHKELTRELETERIAAPIARTPEMAEFLDGFPTRYLRTHSESDIEEDLGLVRKARNASGSAVGLTRQRGTWRITLVAEDREGLFASVAGTLASFGLNILKAEAFANRQGLILDTFVFSDPHRTLELNPGEIDRLRDTLNRVIVGKLDVARLLRNRPKPRLAGRSASVQPKIAFNNDASQSATLIEIVAEDRPGLLYDLSRAITSAGCNIEVVLIDTEAHRALDVFYVTSGGSKLTPELTSDLDNRLQAALSG